MSNDDDNVIDAEIVESLPAVREQATHERGHGINSERDWPSGPTPERRCRAHSSRTGLPCKNAALRGATVCRFHGGAAKHVKAAARARLENAAELMAKQLLGLAVGADSEAVMLAAVKDALDRAGLKAPSEVVLSQSDPKPYEQIFEDIGTGTRADSRAARGVTESDSAPLGNEFAGNTASGGISETPDYRFQAEAGWRDSADRPPFSPASAFTADTAPGHSAPPHRPNAPAQPGTHPAHDHQAGKQAGARHIQGDEAMQIAARLARQKAIESGGHIKYRAHRRGH